MQGIQLDQCPRTTNDGNRHSGRRQDSEWSLSWNNRNVRTSGTIEMSAVIRLSLLLVEPPAPGEILGWTFAGLAAILRRAVGRIGLRRSATRAPAGRLHARWPGPLTRGRVLFSPLGIGRQRAKLRGSGGSAPRTARWRDLPVLQITALKADRQRPIQTQFDHHLAPPLPGPDRLEQLVKAVAEAHRVVVGHHPLLLDRQDRRQVLRRSQRPVRVTRLPRRLAEAAVVRGQQAFQQTVGLRAGRHLRQAQLLDPAVLGGAEGTLDAPLGLGAVGADQADAQLPQGSTELRLGVGHGVALVLGLEDAVPVGVQFQGSAKPTQPAAQQVPVGLGRAGGVETGQHTTGGVVNHADQDQLLSPAFQPVVQGGVQLDQFAKAGTPRPAAAVRFATALTLPQTGGQQPATQGLGADRQPLLGQLRAGEGGAEVGVTLAVGCQHRLLERRIGLPVGGLATQAVKQRGVAVRFELALNAADLTGAEVEQSSRLGLRTFPAQDTVQDLEDITFLLAHRNPVGGWHVDRHGASLAWARRSFLSRADRTFLLSFNKRARQGFWWKVDLQSCRLLDVTRKTSPLAWCPMIDEEVRRFALESAGVGIWCWDIATRTVAWSENLEVLHGLAPGSFAGTFDAFLAEVHPDDREHVLQTVTHATEAADDFHVEYRIIRPDGVVQWVEGKGHVVRNDAGAAVRLLGVCQDVTPRKEAEEALRRSHADLEAHVAKRTAELERANEALRASGARFRALVENSADGLLLLGTDGCILFDATVSGRILGYAGEDFVGRSIFELIHADDREEVSRHFAALLQKGGQASVQFRARHHDGSYRWLEAVGSNRLTEPSIAAIVVNYRDVTVRRQAEEALRASEARYRLLFEQNLAGVLLTGADGRILACNEALARILGCDSCEEVCGRVMQDFYFRPDDRPGLLAGPQQHGALRSREICFHRKDGRPIWVLANVSLLAGTESGPVLHGTLIDITEHKRLEGQYRQAQKMEAVGRLAGGIAHDFNNLLTVIAGYGDVLLELLPKGHSARDLLAEVTRAGERAAALTRQLLAFSRQQILAPRVLDLNAVVLDMGRLLRRLIGEDVDLATVAAPWLWPVKADAGQLEQVLANLAVNARDAMPTGGKLTIETRNVELDDAYVRLHTDARPGPHVLLSVSDTGVGMDEATRAHIFEPFFTTKGEHGTGLGLAMVYGIVRQSGGHVEVYSEAGHGTTFKVYLPRCEETEAPAPVSRRPGTMPSGTATVLLVEDEDAVPSLTRHVLAACGYTVLEARDGAEAMLTAERHGGRIDLLLTDVVMPRMGGREVAERLQGLYPGMRVLFMSGYTDDAVVRHGILEKQVPFLQKPFTPAALAQKVREVLDAGGVSGE